MRPWSSFPTMPGSGCRSKRPAPAEQAKLPGDVSTTSSGSVCADTRNAQMKITSLPARGARKSLVILARPNAGRGGLSARSRITRASPASAYPSPASPPSGRNAPGLRPTLGTSGNCRISGGPSTLYPLARRRRQRRPATAQEWAALPKSKPQRLHASDAPQSFELRDQLGPDPAVHRHQSHSLAARRTATEVERADVDARFAE